MATSLTRNLKLRVDSNLSANSKYNLERIDLLGSTFLTDSTNALNIRSQVNISIEPESPDVGGSGVGGQVSIGNASHILESIGLWADSVSVPVALSLLDQASGGNKYLKLKYLSTLNGTVDTSSDRTLSIDLEGSDRSLLLGGSFGVLGGNLTLNLTGTSSVILPQTGTLSTLAGVETLTNKVMDGLANTFSNLQYSSLSLADSIVNGDISPTAAIVYSKLNLANSLVNSDISNSAAIAYSKLALADSITLADINSAISIPYSYLDLSSSVEATDLVPGVITDLLPSQAGNAGKYLKTDGTVATWQTVAGSSGGVNSYAEDWTSGTSLAVSHGLNSSDVVVSIVDNNNNIIYVDADVTDSNTVTLTSSEAPTGTWRVVVHA